MKFPIRKKSPGEEIMVANSFDLDISTINEPIYTKGLDGCIPSHIEKSSQIVKNNH